MELPTDRLGLLVDQLTTSCDYARARLDGLDDEEYLWEPAPGAWSIRPRAEAKTARAFGAGEWVIDFEIPDPDPAPVTTIAWRLGHLHSCFASRWEWTFGARKEPPETQVDFTPSATEALEAFWAVIDRWIEGVSGLTDEQMDEVGFGQYPYGLDPQLPFICIVWWTNRELIHHAAEVALLRDLWRGPRAVTHEV